MTSCQNPRITHSGVLYKHETLHSHRARQTIVDVEIFGIMSVSYFQLWDNLFVAYAKKTFYDEREGKGKGVFVLTI